MSADDWQPIHVEVSHRIIVRAGARETLELFTPEGERAWVPDWEPRFLHPEDGRTVRGGVFVSREPDGDETVWMVAEYDPRSARARYARITPGRRAAHVSIECEPVDRGTTRVTVSYELTSLSPAGDAEVSEWTEEWFAAHIDEWARRINDHLENS